MELLLTDDWRKQAAQQQQTPDASMQPNEDVEKAFLDQAYMHIQNKATPLMKQQFRVGFEIVHKNDENTRMVGVFVFRVSDQFFYAPVFFLNGSIKGTDLLYRANVKRFVPLNNEWCEFLIQLCTMDEGKGIPIRERQLTRDQLNLLDVVEPPQMFRYRRKYASSAYKDRDKVLGEIDEMLTKAAAIPGLPGTSILKRFISEFGGFNAIKKIANTARHDRSFSTALMKNSHPDHYMPQLPPNPPQQKAAKREPLLVLHTSVLRNKNVKQASARDMCNGYKIEDFRKEADANEYVFADNIQEISSVEAPGVYNVLMVDGDSRKMLVAYYRDMNLARNCSPQPSFTSTYDPQGLGGRRRQIVMVDVESKASDSLAQEEQQWAFGKYESSITDSSLLKELSSAETGKGYRIYDTHDEAFSEAFYVLSKGPSPSGLESLEISTYSAAHPEGTILINPEYVDYDSKDNIFGKRCKIVEVKVEKEGEHDSLRFDRTLGIGNKHTLNAFIFENNFKSATVKVVRRDGDTLYLVSTDRTGGKWTSELSKLSATLRLMADCALREEIAGDIIKQAEENKTGEYKFFHEKKGYNLRFNDWPEFYERTNSEFNVLEQPRTNWMLESQFDRPIHQPHRVGDIWSQDSSEALDTMTPMQLYDTSKQRGIGNLFEHGVVGELVKTYDSNQIIQTYVSDLETALDRIGRIIFLFYWKPEDFAASYGTDDQTSLENKLLSNFKSLGEMTLELLQKAKLHQEGSPSL